MSKAAVVALAANWTAFSELARNTPGAVWLTRPEQLAGLTVGRVLFCPSFLRAPFAPGVLRALLERVK